MAIPAETSVTFTELDVLETQVQAITAAIADAAVDIGLTTTATITYTSDPDTALTDECAAIILAAIKDQDFRAPILLALNTLIEAANVIAVAYDVEPFTLMTSTRSSRRRT
ncbi:MAG: hypothetical protein JNL82_29875 [Myxococcales bacterium]|nr:hypothetical protein [Myxococcales bacterium]